MNIFIKGAVIVLLLATFAKTQCPSNCTCGLSIAGKNFITCNYWNETRLHLPTTTQVLFIESGSFRILNADTFKNLSRLEEITISNSELQEVEPYTFNGLAFLTKVYLYYNKISVLYNATFNNLSSLKYIALNNNNIESIPRNCFINLPLLQYLDLGNNEIEILEEGTFGTLTNLVKLNLEYNKLTRLNDYMFKGLINLKYARLQSNEITEISYNRLLNLHPSSSIDLFENPLNCSCHTFSSLSNMLNNGITISRDAFKSPPWLKGISIHSINETRVNVSCESNQLCFNIRIGCLINGGTKSCSNINQAINCACAQSDTLICSNNFDCRTYGCKKDSSCSLIQQQWKCSENLSSYECNNTECKNNGQCVPVNQKFTCTCKTGFIGETCEQDNKHNTGLDTKYIVLIIFVLLILISIAVVLILCWFFKTRKTNKPTVERASMLK